MLSYIKDLSVDDLFGRGLTEFADVMQELGTKNVSKTTFFERQHAGIRTFIALIKGKIVGTASLYIEPRFAGHVAHIEDLAVAKEYQWQGIGSELMQVLIDVAKHNDCYKVILNCDRRVVPFYKSLGFQEYETQMRLNLE